MTRLEQWTLFTLILIAAVFRIVQLNAPIGWDEAVVFFWIAERSLFAVLSDFSNVGNHLFFTFLMGVSNELFGDAQWVLRLPAFFAGIALVPAVFFFASVFTNKRTAWIASAIATGLNYLIFASTNARGYILQALLVTVVFWSLAKFLLEGYKTKHFWILVFSLALAHYTLPNTIFILPAVFLLPFTLNSQRQYDEKHDGKIKRFKRAFWPIAIAGLFTLLLYLPVAFGTGVSEAIGHKHLRPQSASDALFNLWRQGEAFWIQCHWGVFDFFIWLSLIFMGLGLIRLLCTRNSLFIIFVLNIATMVVLSMFVVRAGPARSYLLFLPFALVVFAYGVEMLIPKIALLGRSCSVPLISVLLALIMGGTSIYCTDLRDNSSLFYARERGARELVVSLAADLRESDFVVHLIPQHKYWMHRLSISRNKLKKFTESDFLHYGGKRIFVILRNRRETVDTIISRSYLSKLNELNLDNFKKPKLYRTFGDFDVYVLRKKREV